MNNQCFYLVTCQIDEKGVVETFKISTEIADLVYEVNLKPPEGYQRKAFWNYADAEKYLRGFLTFEDVFRYELHKNCIKLNQIYTKEISK